MSEQTAYVGCEIFDGDKRHFDSALVVDDSRVVGIYPQQDVPEKIKTVELKHGLLVPGFVDAQVNGGGGVLFNDAPDIETIKTICCAHAAFGTTALMPTLITDTPETTDAAIAAGKSAFIAGVRGFVGLHLEGPHLSHAKSGAHRESLVRPMDDGDLETYILASSLLPKLVITVAPETVDNRKITALANAGIIVCLGHTDASCDDAIEAAKELANWDLDNSINHEKLMEGFYSSLEKALGKALIKDEMTELRNEYDRRS